MKRVAVVGSGISGLAAAQALVPFAQVTLLEADDRFGGHAHTVDITLPDANGSPVTHGVDTGFLVYNERTYPELVRLFKTLGVDTAPAEMSFSVQSRADGLEWSGSDLGSIFAQRRNLIRPRFLSMLSAVLRFNRLATALAEASNDGDMSEPIGDFLDRHAFDADFRNWYLLPMVGSIWSCPTDQMLLFPVGTLIRFCHNHGLIRITDRPQWFTVRGGSARYVRKLLAHIGDARLSTPVRSIRRVPPHAGRVGVMVATDHGSERYDEVVLACHSDQALALMADATVAEAAVLGAIRT
ncbi:MAG: FAD-dependent oxidoreductase, partial [Rubrivivax sp.]